MKKIIVLIIILLPNLSILAQNKLTSAGHTLAMYESHRNFTLEQKVFNRTHRLKSLLQPSAAEKLDLIVQRLLTHLTSRGTKNIDPYSFAQQELRKKFAKLSNKQSGLLSFYVLAEAAQILSFHDKMKDELDSLGKLSEEDSLNLQIAMDRRSELMNTISNIIKKISATQDAIIQNIK